MGYPENPLDPLAPRPTTLDLILKTVFVCLYNYNFNNYNNNIREIYIGIL